MNKTKRGCVWFILPLLLVSLLNIQAAEQSVRPTGAVIKITSIEEFDRYLKSGNYIVAYFSSETCGPCKAFHDTYYEMAKEYPDVIFLEICHGTFAGTEKLVNKFAVPSFPTFAFFDKSGTKKNSFSGTNESTKGKIVGEIVMLKQEKCGTVPTAPARPQQQPVQKPVQPKPAPAKSVQNQVPAKQMHHNMPQQQMPKQNMHNAQPPAPVVQQASMKMVPQNPSMMQQPNSYRPQAATVNGRNVARQAPTTARSGKPIRNPRIRRLGRRMRQRDVSIEYQ